MVKIDYCDICDLDGETSKAVAGYKDLAGEEWVICRKHLKHVKENGDLEYWML